MLVLGRREGEQIIINGDLLVRICRIEWKSNLVKVGFEASEDSYVIDRLEIHKRKMRERDCLCRKCGNPL